MTSSTRHFALPAIAVAIAALSGCAVNDAPVVTRLPDGSVAYRMICDPTGNGMNYCFEKAGKSCGEQGYTIVGSGGEFLSSSDVAETELANFANQYQFDRNSILIKCGE